MNDRADRPDNAGRPRRAEGNPRRNNNDSRGSQPRDGHRSHRDNDRRNSRDDKPRGDRAGGNRDRGDYRRDERGERRNGWSERRDERGGYRSARPARDDNRPYRGDRSDQPYRENRKDREGRGDRFERDDRSGRPYRDNRSERPYRENRSERPYRENRSDRSWRDDRRQNTGERPERPERPERREHDRGGRNFKRDGRDERDPRGRGGTRGGGRSDRGGSAREYTEEERLRHSLRPVRGEHDDPVIADHVRPGDLHPAARNELKTLQPDVQERVALHLAMAAELIDTDPELAHQHAISASRRAGRIPVVRETLAITAYRTGDFALAIREMRTFRRLSGRDSNIAIMVDSERGLGRPEKAIETGLEVDPRELETVDHVYLAIAMSGARLDLGQTQQALFELEIPELNPGKAFSWSPELFGAYAAVLEDLGRAEEAAEWFANADRAMAALEAHFGALDEIEVLEIEEHDEQGAHEDTTNAKTSDSETSDNDSDEQSEE